MNATRRRVLACVAAVGLPGCLGFGDDGSTAEPQGTATTREGETAATTNSTTTTTHGSGIDHPAAAGLADQPILGKADAPALVVAFEDPSCLVCRRFETETFPTLREYADGGSLRFAYRVFPVVYEWGEPAVQALEATYARSEAAFWALKSHYYDEQDAFDAENVLERTEAFLAENTDVDAAAVVADAGEKAYDAQVQADLAAGRDAGASSTPTFFLFRGGTYRTKIVGAKDADVFAAALEL